MSISVAILGAGGHAAVVMDALTLNGVAFTLWDENDAVVGTRRMDQPVEKLSEASWSDMGDHVHVAVGNNRVRERIARQALAKGKVLYTVVHSAATIAAAGTVDPGVFVGAGAVVGPMAAVGQGSIINHGAVVDHDARVGEFAHVAPNATLSGRVCVGDGALCGASCVVLPGTVVGARSVVAAGAVVHRDVPANCTVAGLPAREMPS